MKLDPKLAIIIVNWNAGQQLIKLLESIVQHHQGLVETVIVVDNDSKDESFTQVERLEKLPFEFLTIRNQKNIGFGAACNQGVLISRSEYILFLNPDTKLFENSLSVPLKFLQHKSSDDIGIVGIQLIDGDNQISRSCARIPTLSIFAAQAFGLNRVPTFSRLNMHMKDWAHDRTLVVDHVIGAFYLMRRSLFEDLDGFDERFFVYLEDLDLSLRARKMGYRSIFLANAQAFHFGGGTSQQVKAHRLFYSLRSRLIFCFKHLGFWQAWIVFILTMVIEPITRSFFSLVRSGFSDVFNTWYAYAMLWGDMPNILKKRSR